MNGKHFSIRMDRQTGDFWIAYAPRGAVPRRVRNVTQDILLALCADLIAEDNSEAVEREVWFAEQDGQRWGARINIEVIKQ